MDELIDKVNKLMRENIQNLEKEKVKINNHIKKLTTNFDSRDIEKLNKLANEVSKIDFTIFQFYTFLGGLPDKIKSK